MTFVSQLLLNGEKWVRCVYCIHHHMGHTWVDQVTVAGSEVVNHESIQGNMPCIYHWYCYCIVYAQYSGKYFIMLNSFLIAFAFYPHWAL